MHITEEDLAEETIIRRIPRNYRSCTTENAQVEAISLTPPRRPTGEPPHTQSDPPSSQTYTTFTFTFKPILAVLASFIARILLLLKFLCLWRFFTSKRARDNPNPNTEAHPSILKNPSPPVQDWKRRRLLDRRKREIERARDGHKNGVVVAFVGPGPLAAPGSDVVSRWIPEDEDEDGGESEPVSDSSSSSSLTFPIGDRDGGIRIKDEDEDSCLPLATLPVSYKDAFVSLSHDSYYPDYRERRRTLSTSTSNSDFEPRSERAYASRSPSLSDADDSELSQSEDSISVAYSGCCSSRTLCSGDRSEWGDEDDLEFETELISSTKGTFDAR